MRPSVFVLLLAARAFADASAPSVAKDWRDGCVRRLEAARKELAQLDPAFPSTGMARSEGHGVFVLSFDDHVAGVYKAGILDSLPDRSTGWSRFLDHRGIKLRRQVGAVGADVSAPWSPPQRSERFIDVMQRALDDCLAMAPVPSGDGPKFSGRYSLSSTVENDGCGGRIVFLAKTMSVDVAANRLRVDAGEGPHRAWVEDGKLVAAGNFSSKAAGSLACDGARVVEWWELRRDGDGLDSLLDSTWRLKPDCDRQCTVRFRVKARPVK